MIRLPKLNFVKLIPWLFILFILIFIHTRGLIYSDEGYILNSASRFLSGEVPYKDFQFVYPPGPIFVTSLPFVLFGESILSSRILMIFLSFTTAIALYLISKVLTKNETVRFLPVLMYVAWGPLQINFAWPLMFVLSAGVLSTLFLLYANKEKTSKYLFIAGLFTAMAILFKQNLGIAIFLNSILFFIFSREKKYTPFLYGVLIVFVFVFLYFLATKSLVPFIENLYFHTFIKIIIEGTISTPFIYKSGFAYMLGKTTFYLLPLIISSVALYLFFRENKKYLFLASFTFLLYLFGIRPVTDFVHLAFLISIIGIPLLMIYKRLKNSNLRLGLIVFSLILIIVGVYSAFFRGYYRWEAPLKDHKYFISSDKIQVWTDGKYNSELVDLVKYLEKETQSGEYIFINYYSPLIYFVTDTRNATQFDYLSPQALSSGFQNDIIRDLRDKKVKIVITHRLRNNEESPITDYIKQEFEIKDTIGDFTIWRKSIDKLNTL